MTRNVTPKKDNHQPGEDWILEVLGVPYGGPYGGKDAQGEYFTENSDLWLERIPKRPIVYYHGLEDSTPQVIGEDLGWEQRPDGVWFRVMLDQASALARRVWDAARQGLARASSGAINHLVRVANDGQILVWPVGELSLIDLREHEPVNPYAVAIPEQPYQIDMARAKAIFAAAGLGGVEVFGSPHPVEPSARRPHSDLLRRFGRGKERRE